jgi:hypothetical protein
MFVKAVILFAIAAVFGLYMAILHTRGRTPPPAVAAVLHGLFAVGGVVVLFLGILPIGFGTVHTWALVLFAVAALGGLFLLSHHLRGKPLPGGVIVIHAIVAVSAFVILCVAALVLH